MKARRHRTSSLLARIRGYDFALCSDAELRDAFQGLKSSSGKAADGEELLPAAFAIVSEAIDRRLGVWRLFGDDGGDYGRAGGPVIAGVVDSVARQRKFRRAGDILLPAGFYRAARRGDGAGRLRFRATGEQILAGIHLFRGRVAQMDAGEGKTVAAAFPAALHALLGNPVHVITANDYLAERDAQLLGPVYQSLGISSGAVLEHTEGAERRQVYRREIVYGAMRELGFDFLRDNLKSTAAERVGRDLGAGCAVAIVDEADHALIDEAFTPMIISGGPAGSSRAARRADRAVAEMTRRQQDYAGELAAELDSVLDGPGGESGGQLRLLARLMLAEPGHPALQRLGAVQPRSLKRARGLVEQDSTGQDSHDITSSLYYAIADGNRFVTLTERGRDFLEERLGAFHHWNGNGNGDGGDGPARGGMALTERRRRDGRAARKLSRQYGLGNQVLQSLRARLLLRRGVDYLVDGDAVVLIDQHTGRPKPGNIYQHGLQAAVEAKEGVTVRPESETLAWVSVAGFVSRYGLVCGITGTAASASAEFRRKYGLEVAVIPPVKAPLRTSLAAKVFLTRRDKLSAVVDEVVSRYRTGQPVLAAARTVEQSEELSRRLRERKVPHRLLNAVTTPAEAAIVRGAGAFGAVTVATSVAGRGTDIVLEPGLNARIARRTAERIGRMLAPVAGAPVAGEVEVSCHLAEQAQVLRVELARCGRLDTAELPGGRLRVRRGGGGPGGGRRTMAFGLGLCVISTEIYDSRRVELQLHGRSGRQGEFGLTQTFLSLEDGPASPVLRDDWADGILKLAGCRRSDAAGRVYYSGPEVGRRIEGVQAAAQREGETYRGLMQDYAAEFDRQTHLYHQCRQRVMDWPSVDVPGLCRDAARRVAARLSVRYLGQGADDGYARRFGRMAEEARLDYGVDCAALYGLDLAAVPQELAGLFVARLGDGDGLFSRVARLLYLQVCGELWPGHLAGLRDSMSSQLLSSLGHKSAVAQYVRRSAEAWREYWEAVDAEFVSRLLGMGELAVSSSESTSPVAVGWETELLLSQRGDG